MLDALTLDQMRVFIAVVETGSFSAAARRLGRVQSAVSQSVKSMETTLRLDLFDREARTPRVTAAGAALFGEASDILSDVDAFKRRAASIAGGLPPQLTLAVDNGFPSPPLMESLQAFRSMFPGIPVKLFTEGLGATEQRLRSDAARLAIYSPLFGAHDGLEIEFLAKIRIVPVVSSNHPLAQKEGLVRLSDLRKHVQLVATDRTQGIHSLVLSSACWMFADQYSRLEHVRHGFGWSFAPHHIVRGGIERGELKMLRFEMFNGLSLSLPLYFASLRGQERDAGTSWFIHDLRTRVHDLTDIFVQPEDDDDTVPYSLELPTETQNRSI